MTVADSHGAEASWPSWLPLCCMPLASSDKKSGRKSSFTTISTQDASWPLSKLSDDELLMDQDEKHPHNAVIYDQPIHHPRPVALPEMASHRRNVLEKSPRGNVAPKKRRFMSLSSSSSSRRPVISAPSHFRHISTGSPQFDFPEPTPSRNSENIRPARQLPRRAFRPLELSIYLPENRTSPMLPHFAMSGQVSAPEPVYDPSEAEKKRGYDVEPPKTPDQSEKPPVKKLGSPFAPIRMVTAEDQETLVSTLTETEKDSDKATVESRPLEHQRSFSSVSFHFPRRQPSDTTDSSPFTIHEYDEEIPPLIPPKARGRNRAYTAPNVESIKERVASAMIEVERLQKQIDDVIERQSIYSVSRPSTSHSVARTLPDLEPMPSIPALPPAAPSFAERLNSDIERPHTAPIKTPTHTHRRAKTAGDVSNRPHTPSPRARKEEKDEETPLPPPLPLVLRPPLRKKKSFSRVSNWLFPSDHNRDLSFDSVTNLPRPVTGKDGYYQCVSLGETQGRPSADSVATVSTWETDDDRTFPSTWSPGSTAVTRGDEPLISRSATFGRKDVAPHRTSVGIAV